LLPHRELVLPHAELVGHVLAASVPDLHVPVGEVAPDRVGLPALLDLELHPERSPVPGLEALERGEQAFLAPVAVEPVEPCLEGGDQGGLAALVVVDDERQTVGGEAELAAQPAETVDLESKNPHSPRSS